MVLGSSLLAKSSCGGPSPLVTKSTNKYSKIQPWWVGKSFWLRIWLVLTRVQNEKYCDHEVCIKKCTHNIYCWLLGQASHWYVCSLLTAIYTPRSVQLKCSIFVSIFILWLLDFKETVRKFIVIFKKTCKNFLKPCLIRLKRLFQGVSKIVSNNQRISWKHLRT